MHFLDRICDRVISLKRPEGPKGSRTFNFSLLLKAGKCEKPPKTYHAGKMMAKEYQHAKEMFFNALFDTTGCKWMGKPYEHDMFGY